MQFGAGRGFWRCADHAATLAAHLFFSSIFLSTAAFARSDEVALSSSDQAVLSEPEAAIVVGTRAAIGTDTAAQKAAEGVVGGVLGGILGRGDDSRRASDRPDTVRDPTRKNDYVGIEAMNGRLETAARAQWTENGLLISARIDGAPGKGTFHTIFLQACDGRRFYPFRYDIYKLWPERSVSVGWSRTTSVDGQVVDRDSGSLSEAWGEGVGFGPRGSGQGIWKELGFERAHHGARQLGAYIDIDPAEFALLGELGLFVHATLPEREPVTTAASAWLIGPHEGGEVRVATPDWHPDGWWGHCGGRPADLVAGAGALPSGTGQEEEGHEFWVPFDLAGVEAKVMSQPKSGGGGSIELSESAAAAEPETTKSTAKEEGEAEDEPACGSVAGTVTTPKQLRKVLRNIVVYVTGDCDYCPPAPERDPVVIKEDDDGIQPSFVVVPVGTTIELVNDLGKESHFAPEFIPSPVDQRRTHVLPALAKGERTKFTPTIADSGNIDGDYLVASSWHKRSDGKMFVTPNQCYSIVDENGYYSIGELPPGEYKLKVYTQPRRTNLAEADVTVKAGEVIVQDFTLDRVVDKEGTE